MITVKLIACYENKQHRLYIR